MWAKMVEHHGWQVASSFAAPADEAARTRESVGLADVSWMSKFNLQGRGLRTRPTWDPRLPVWPLRQRQYLADVRTLGGRSQSESA